MQKRTAISPVGAAAVGSVVLALLIWAALGIFAPGQAGFGSEGLGAARGLVLIAVGLFAVAMTVWSRFQRKKDEDL